MHLKKIENNNVNKSQKDQEQQSQCNWKRSVRVYQQHSTLPPFAFKDYDEGNFNQDNNDHAVHDYHDDEEDDECVEERSKDNEELF